MIEAAKRDVEDFYEEITFRRERKSGGGLKTREKRDPTDFFRPKNSGEKTEEEEEEKDQEEIQEEEERDTHHDTPNLEDEEEGSDADKSDRDIFRGRFSSQKSTRKSEPPKPAVPAPGSMAKTLVEMITQAVHCGALAEESRLHNMYETNSMYRDQNY